jgi:hypothetical protein
MARPTKLTPETQETIVQGVRVGLTYEHACLRAGVSYETFHRWMTWGDPGVRGRAAFRVFRQAIERAKGDALVKWAGLIDKAAADGDWRAAAWKMERRFPESYGRTRVEHTGADGAPMRLHTSVTTGADLANLTDAELEQLEALLAKAAPIAARAAPARALAPMPALGPMDDDDDEG